MKNVNRGSIPASPPTVRALKPAESGAGDRAAQIVLNGQPRKIQWVQAGPAGDSILKALEGNYASSKSAFAPLQTLAPQKTTAHAASSTGSLEANAADWVGITAGMDFLTQLHCSAALGGQTFKAVAAEMHLDSTRTGRVADSIDAQMRQWFEMQRANGTSPVQPRQAHEELRTTLRAALKNQ